jgi:excinuclease UvrABC nuclease subunit
MRRDRNSQSYLKIAQADFSKAEVERLVKKVRQILMDKVPSKRFVKDELSRYLNVYTMRTSSPKVPYKEICEKIYPNIAFGENRRRALIKDFNNAKEIIHNIEKDIQIWWSPESDK